MNSLYQIDKLDEKNYDVWCIQMKSVLIHSDLWNVVCGKSTRSDAKKVDEWEQLNEKALATITLSVKASQLSHLKSCSTAFEAWEKLKEIHRPSGPVRKVSLYKKLLNSRMSDGEDMCNFLNEFASAVDKLAEVGIVLQDELVVIILLSSLPKCYEQFVVAMETRDSLPSFQILKVKLLEEADRKSQDCARENNGDSHAYVARGKNNSGEKSVKRNVKKQNFKCFKCGKRGHYAANCYTNTNKQVKEENKREQQFSVLAAADVNVINKWTWCLDSGATAHMCCNKNFFVELNKHNENIYLAGENCMVAEGIGKIEFEVDNCKVILQNVLYVPEMDGNFMSVCRLCENGYQIVFNVNGAQVMDKNGNVMFHAMKRQKLFVIEKENQQCFSAVTKNEVKWHERFGHLNYRSLRELSSKNMVSGMKDVKFNSENPCKVCMKAKIHAKPHKNSESRSSGILDKIHTDVCGPFNTDSLGGSRYFLTFIDDHSRRIYVYFLKGKDEVFMKFKIFKEMIERQTSRKIKVIRSDNGREFVNGQFNEYLEKNGIIRELTVPYTPQQNGVAERANRTIVEMSRAMLLQSGLDESLWAEAVATAVYIRNRSPTKVLENVTPYEVFTGKKPSVEHFRIFGSVAVALDKTAHKKFQQKGIEYRMVGYSLTAKAYRLYDAEKRVVVERRDVMFIEPTTPSMSEVVDISEFVIHDEPSNNNNNNEDLNASMSEDEFIGFEDEPTSSSSEDFRECEESNQTLSEEELVVKKADKPKTVHTGKPGRSKKVRNVINAAKNVEVEIPQTVEDALNGVNSSEWRESMRKEYDALVANDTWSLVELPKGKKAIGSKWVFALKRNKYGQVEKFKSRLVAKGCSQQWGVDYTETFSPVIRYETIRMLFALAAEQKMYVHQMDVCTAYLNGELSEEVYMRQPQEFVDKEYPNYVLKLKKSIYGLKQSGREWNLKLDETLRNIGFVPCVNEPCLYRMSHHDKLCLIAVYVDDLLICCEDKDIMLQLKGRISEVFDCVDKGQVNLFLGMQVEREGELGAITVSQSQYINDLLKQHNMETCRPASTPLDTSFQVACTNEKCTKVDTVSYQSSIGSLMYLAMCTRPDIIHSVSKLAQRNTDPHKEHEAGIKHILRYLSNTKDLKLAYKCTGKKIEGYVDADWASCTLDRKSYTGYAFFLGGSVFSWSSKKQGCVALSSTEAEYIAMAAAVKEAAYLKSLLEEIGLADGQPVVIYGDNMSAQQLAKNPMYHARTKHIDIRYHFVRELVTDKIVELKYMPTDQMIADILTKNLSKLKHSKFVKCLGLN